MALLDLFSYACARASTARDGALARWSTRGVRPRSALAKAAVLRTVSFSFVLTLLRLRRRQCGHDPSPGGARGACAPYEHSQKQPCCALSLFCPRLSALYAPRYGARISPVEHAGRAPPMGTRKNALRRWRCSIFFLMPALVQARRGTGRLPGGARGACAPVRHSQKQPCCALSLFHLCSLFYACGVGSVHK